MIGLTKIGFSNVPLSTYKIMCTPSVTGAGHEREGATRNERKPGRRRSFLPAFLLVGLALLLAPAAHAQLIPSFGSNRAGTAGLAFLKVSSDARASALGGTVVSNAMDASALFWNPALAAQTTDHQLGFSHGVYFVDTQIDYVGGIYHARPLGLTLGLSLQTFTSGDMEVTTEFEPFGTGETFRLVDMAVGFTVAQALTDLFSYGITAKYVRESVAGLTAQTGLLDLGLFYRVGETGAQMAVAIRNFGLDAAMTGEIERYTAPGEGDVVETVDDFDDLAPPTTFLLGVSYELFRSNPMNALTLSGQLTNPNDNAESFNVGIEYTWNNLLALRGGYRIGVEEYTTPSAGVGLLLPEIAGPLGVRFDYGFSQLERLGTIHRLGLNLSL